MNLAKRRKINDTYSSLSKPFRSPLKASAPSPKTSLEKSNNLEQQDSDRNPIVTPITKGTTVTSDGTRPTDATDPHSSSRQQEYIDLTQELRSLRQDLDTAKQALHLSQSTTQQSLEAAIAKWQSIARDAADDLFSLSALRVQHMGGLAAWYKTTQEADPDQSNGQVDEEESVQEVGERALPGEAQGTNHRQQQQQQQYFTMDLMLCQMNINPDTLGFDVDSQSWT